MENIIIKNAKYSKWQKSHTFENCKLNRKDYGHFLIDYITGEQNGFVLNLNGAWGTGKTEFLKRIYSDLLGKYYPVIYIDAWESDFSKDPLTVVTSELLSQLEKFNDGIGSENAIRQVKEYCGKVIKGALVGVAGFTTSKLLNDSNIGMETIKQLLESDSESFTTQLTKDYTEQIEAIHNIRNLLGQLAEVLQRNYSAKLPIVVLVDELDRCRPTYAIEMLEVIKHFFTTDSFVFIVATDTEQLCHSITSIYGNNFDSLQYIKRFFDRKASLPSPNIKSYLNALNKNFDAYSPLRLFPFIDNMTLSENINSCISSLAFAYDLKIRDVDQLVNKVHSCLRSACTVKEKTGKLQLINFPALVIGLIEQDRGYLSFSERDDFTESQTNEINNKLRLADDLPVSKYITIVMKCVTQTKKQYNNNWGESYSENRLPSSPELDRLKSENSSSNLKRLIGSLNAEIRNYYQQPDKSKYWMWSDLKKVIELAGNIE